MAFRFSKIKDFFRGSDINNLFQEIGASILGIFLGLLAYEKRDEIFGLFGMQGGKEFTFTFPESWTAQENQFFFITGLIIFGAILVLKILIYFKALDLNKIFHSKQKKEKGFNFNGIMQEICTILMGIVFGIFSSPVSKRMMLLFEKSEYPDPVPGIIVVSICLLIKLLIYSKAVNLNSFSSRKSKLFNPSELGSFFRKADWNDPIKNFLSVMIGIGIGLYLYQSNLVFLPQEALGEEGWQAIRDVGNKTLNIFVQKKAQKKSSGKAPKKEIKFIPETISEKEKRPFWIIGIIIVSASVAIKLLMYLGFLNFNKIRNQLLGGSSKESFVGKDYNGIIDEILMLILSTVAGTVATPVFNNLRGQETPYPYGGWELVLIAILALIKLAFLMGVLDFNSSSKKSTLKKSVHRRR